MNETNGSTVKTEKIDSNGSNARELAPEERYLIGVLRDFVLDRDPERPPENFDAQFFFQTATRQNVVAIVADETLKRPEYYPEKLVFELKQARARIIGFYFTRQAEIDALESLFEENEIRFIPLKGAVTKTLYPLPYQREACDYDVLLDAADVLRASELAIERLGFAPKETLLNPDAVHVSVCQKTTATNVELHRKLFTSNLFVELTTEEVWRRSTPVAPSRFERRMTPEDFYSHMLAHLAQHFANLGATSRYFLDVYFFLRRFGDSFDRSTVEARFQATGSLRFVENVELAARVWFAGETPPAESEPTLDALLRRLFVPDRFDPLINDLSRTSEVKPSKWNALKRKIGDSTSARFPNANLKGRPAATRPFWTAFYLTLAVAQGLTRPRVYRNLWDVLRRSQRQLDEAVAAKRDFERFFGLRDVRK